MYRFQLSGVPVECDTVDEFFDATGISRPTEPFPSVPAPLPATFPSKQAIVSTLVEKGRMNPTGKTKRCKACKKVFPIATRRDCAAVRCPACRGDESSDAPPAPSQASHVRRKPDVAAAKKLLARPPIRPSEPAKSCAKCGDKTRLSDLDTAGLCNDCQWPTGAPK